MCLWQWVQSGLSDRLLSRHRLGFRLPYPGNDLSLFFLVCFFLFLFVLSKDYWAVRESIVTHGDINYQWVHTTKINSAVAGLVAVRLPYLSFIKEGKSLRGNHIAYPTASTHRMDNSSNIWPTKLSVMWKYAEKTPEKQRVKTYKCQRKGIVG